MKFILNTIYWCITIPILVVMLFYLPTFTLIMLSIVLVIGIIGGIMLWKYRNRRR